MLSQGDPVYDYIDGKIEDLKVHHIYPLQEDVNRLRSAVVELKSSLVSHVVYTYLISRLDSASHSMTVSVFESELTQLRTRLASGYVPDDALREWRSNILSKLSHIIDPVIYPQKLEHVLPSSIWDEIVGLESQTD